MCVVAAGAKAKPAAAARGMLVGVFDPNRPFDTPDTTFPTLVNLRAQIIRVNLNWNEVATKRPLKPTDPADPAYDWSRYDQLMLNAKKYKIQVLFTIFGTPRWANGTKKGINRAPRQMAFLKYFATAAAKRYSGTYKRDDDTVLPAVRKWLAWNEPNNPVFLTPQWTKINNKRYVATAAKLYVGICTAVWSGVHATNLKQEVVACGATDPRGNNSGKNRRPSISPLAFLAWLKKFGLKHFDVYAHHPYYSRPAETPSTKPNDQERRHAREHRRPDQASRQALREQEALDHRIRLPDEPARPDVRRLVGQAGQVPDAGVLDRTQKSEDHDDALVPAPRRRPPRRLAVRLVHGGRQEEAFVQRLQAPATLGLWL